MKPRLVKLTFVSSCALGATLLAAHAFAQTTAQPTAQTAAHPTAQAGGAAAATTLRGPAGAAKAPSVTPPLTATAAPTTNVTTNMTANVTANVRAPNPASARTTITAAGSVIILADGIVANASMAQVQPPAPGFVYER